MKTPQQELSEIKAIMERSTRFISLSGISGVMAGIYALIASALAYYWVYYPNSPFGFRISYVNNELILMKLVITAIIVLALSVGTGVYLTKKKTQKLNTKFWSTTSRRFLFALFIPILVGGFFTLALIIRGYLIIVAPATLIFYGMGLLNASHFTLSDIKYLAYCQIALGILSAFFPGYGLIFWSLGFGVLHIVYGVTMHLKYDR
ncbi:hypothetical protein GCM10011506_32350 [Marivirga lumbricoides]|uniref:Uncharacterized protein n=1 Tax=Marivirga lumbricoides TaxID=1046115 RepID=A0ABQ1MP77_9BACT|nr:hypothetical protein GCM10011506_32350 [Marivirga lumbricoides]